MTFSNEIDIVLKSGDVWSLQMTDSLLAQIREAYNLGIEDVIDERHVKSFLVGAIQNGLEKENVF